MRRALELLLVVAIASTPAFARESAPSDFAQCVVHDVEAQICYLRCSGNQSLGGNLTVNGTLTVTGLATFGGNVVPSASGSKDLGSAALKWHDLIMAGTVANSVGSGFKALAVTTNGAIVDFGAGANDQCTSDGTTVTFAGPIASAGSINSSSAAAPQFTCSGAGACELRSTSSGQTTRADCTGTCTVAIGDGTATTVIVGRAGQTSTINGSGAFGTREFLLDKVSSGIGAGSLLATGTNYSGYKLPQAWTLTHLSINVTTASAATVANTVFTATDGTNTCTFTYACNTVTNTTGVKDVAAVNGAGTGCVYAAAALVTLSVTTQGCATAATVNSITTWGKPQ